MLRVGMADAWFLGKCMDAGSVTSMIHRDVAPLKLLHGSSVR
jgi:hypothetical protein